MTKPRFLIPKLSPMEAESADTLPGEGLDRFFPRGGRARLAERVSRPCVPGGELIIAVAGGAAPVPHGAALLLNAAAGSVRS